MAPGFQGGSSRFRLQLQKDDFQDIARGIEKWNIPKARGEFLVANMWEQIKEFQVIRKEVDNWKSDSVQLCAKFYKFRAEHRIFNFRIWFKILTLQNPQAIRLELDDKYTEIEAFERKLEDLNMTSKSLHNQLLEWDLMTSWTKRGAFLKSGSLSTTLLSTSSLLVVQQQEQRTRALQRQAMTGATVGSECSMAGNCLYAQNCVQTSLHGWGLSISYRP